MTERPFLTARWEHLLILNYECPREALEPLVPAGTELDLWNGRALVSLVGFMFRDTRVRGLSIPCHRTFEEVNLRFYVRRVVGDEVRRAVVFIREIVPKRAIVEVARRFYNEPYERASSMTHRTTLSEGSGRHVEYSWRARGEAYSMSAAVEGPAALIAPGSESEFVAEHYWGYTRQRDGGTLEYRVAHPRWKAWEVVKAAVRVRGAFTALYGDEFGDVLSRGPASSLLALGSGVSVYRGVTIG